MSKVLIDEKVLKGLYRSQQILWAIYDYDCSDEALEKRQQALTEFQDTDPDCKTWIEYVQKYYELFKERYVTSYKDLITDFEETTSLGCAEAATEEVMIDVVQNLINSYGSNRWIDECFITNEYFKENIIDLQTFAEDFWKECIQLAANVLRSNDNE